jgi:hypothetical protein
MLQPLLKEMRSLAEPSRLDGMARYGTSPPIDSA